MLGVRLSNEVRAWRRYDHPLIALRGGDRVAFRPPLILPAPKVMTPFGAGGSVFPAAGVPHSGVSARAPMHMMYPTGSRCGSLPGTPDTLIGTIPWPYLEAVVADGA